MSLKIIGTGRSVPERHVSNKELEAFMDTSDEWIKTRTGIEKRYISIDETLCDISSAAAKAAIESAGISPDELDLIICATLQGDFITPSLASMVQKEIEAHCPAFDLNGACAGFIWGLDVAASYILSGRANTILIVCADQMSKFVDWSDRSTAVLFGDGAGACVVTKGDCLKYIHMTTAGASCILNVPASANSSPFGHKGGFKTRVHMDGQEVFKFAVSMIEKETAIALEAIGANDMDIDYYILHQANKRIIDFARTKLKLPEEKFPINIQSYGNISAATIPTLLDEMSRDGRLKGGELLLMTAFGAGLTTGTCILSW